MNSKQFSLFGKDIEMDFLSGDDLDKDNFSSFSWALPPAFSEPLCYCRFEEGDRLYDTHKAYIGTWTESLKHISYGIQIIFPPRAIKNKHDEDSESVFVNNWYKTVVFTLTNYKTKETKEITTAQGKLYSFLWKGDFSYFEEDKEIAIPTQPLKSIKFLKQSESYFKPAIATLKFRKASFFIMPYDKSNSLLKSKFDKVNIRLSKDFDEKCILFERANRIFNQHTEEFIPTLQFVCFVIDTDKPINIEESLKKALYKPSRDKKTKKDMFSLKKHGYFKSFA